MNEFYPCPACGSQVVWSMNNTRVGAETSINCTKYHTQSRIDLKPKQDWFCAWVGVARRGEDREVRLYHNDGITLLRKRCN